MRRNANTDKRKIVSCGHVSAHMHMHIHTPKHKWKHNAYMNKVFRNLLYLQRILSLEQNGDSELDAWTNFLAHLDTVEKDTYFCLSHLQGKRRRDSTGGHQLKQNGPGKGHSCPDTCLLWILICRTRGKNGNMGSLLGHYSKHQNSSREC